MSTLTEQIISLITQNPTKTASEIASLLATSRQHVWDTAKRNGLTLPKGGNWKFCVCGAKISKSATLCPQCTKASKRITFKCDVCGNEKTVLKSVYKRSEMHFCSRKCRGWWLGKHHRTRSEIP